MKASLRQQVFERAHHCCEYCQACERLTGQPMHVDHIDPGGGDDVDNLCLACANCNQSKHAVTSATDPLTNEVVSLYNPRIQDWTAHFAWIDDGLRVQGLTPTGRATVERLKINQERSVVARASWILTGLHPPDFG
jgi:hypothetical protein